MLSCTVWDMDMDIGNQESSAKKVKGNLLRKKKKNIPQRGYNEWNFKNVDESIIILLKGLLLSSLISLVIIFHQFLTYSLLVNINGK